MAYDRSEAVKYASIWWNKRNSAYYDFDKLGGDCTNFISQCLHAGGIEMNHSRNGWFYNYLSSRAPAWSGVEELYNFAINNNSKYGVRAVEVGIEQIEVGDIIQLNQKGIRFNHNLIVVGMSYYKTPENIFIACHTGDAFNKRLSEYRYQKIRFLKILNN